MPRQKDIYLGRHKKDWATYEQSAERVKDPHKHDVLCGRGGRVNVWPGNVAYRRVVEYNKEKCRTLSNPHKRLLARSIVDAVAQQDPPGRFLQRTKEGDWMNIGYNPAVHKTGQALRERNRDESDNESDGESDENRQNEKALPTKVTNVDPNLPPIDVKRDLGGSSGPAPSIAGGLPQHLSTVEAQMVQAMAPMMGAPPAMGHHQHHVVMHPNMAHMLAARRMHTNATHHATLTPAPGLPQARPAEPQQLAQMLAASMNAAAPPGRVLQTQQAETQNDLAQRLAAINCSGQPLDAASLRALSAFAMFSPQGFSASAAQAAIAAGAGGGAKVDGGGREAFSSAQSTMRLAPSQQQHLSPAPINAFNAPVSRAVGENPSAAEATAQVPHQAMAPHFAATSFQRPVSELQVGTTSQFVPGHALPHVVGPAAAMSASVQAAEPDSVPTLPHRKRRALMTQPLADHRQQEERVAGFENSSSIRTPLEEVSVAAVAPSPRQQINAKMLRVAGKVGHTFNNSVSLIAGNAVAASSRAPENVATSSLRKPSIEASTPSQDDRMGPRRISSALAAISARGRKRSSTQGTGVVANNNATIPRSDLKPPPATNFHFGTQRRQETEQQLRDDLLSDLSDNDELSKHAGSLLCLPDVEGDHEFDLLSECNSVLDIDEARRNGLLTKLYPSDDEEDENAEAHSTTSGRKYVEVMNAYCGIPLVDSQDEVVTPNLEVHAGVPLDSPCSSPTPMFEDGGPSVVVTATRQALPVAFGAGMIPVGGGLQATVRASPRYCIPQ